MPTKYPALFLFEQAYVYERGGRRRKRVVAVGVNEIKNYTLRVPRRLTKPAPPLLIAKLRYTLQ